MLLESWAVIRGGYRVRNVERKEMGFSRVHRPIIMQEANVCINVWLGVSLR
jgi:hypothetical protein